jgi:asparagine synthase (glutamine-hydrolysing)
VILAKTRTSSRQITGRGLRGSIGLPPDLQQRWQAHHPLTNGSDTAPELQHDSFACWLDQQAIHSPQDWLRILRSGQLERVSGAFALAWRPDPDTLWLYRDAPGERSLFYAPLAGGLIFSSDLRDLVRMLPRQLNLQALARYLSYAYLPGRETLLQGIYQLLPGEALRWQNGQLQRQLFWQLPQTSPQQLSESQWRNHLRDSLEQAVWRRYSGEPVHASLSGGVDSSLVVALLARLSNQPVQTWSLAFGKAHRHELPFSERVALHCGSRHRVLQIQPKQIRQQLDAVMARLGNPIGDPLTVPNALLFAQVARESPVLFNGEGGDPNFGGPKNIPMLLADLYGDPRQRADRYLKIYRKAYGDLPQLLTPAAWQGVDLAALQAELAPFLADDSQLMAGLMRLNTVFKGAHHILYKVNALSAPLGLQPASPLFDREVSALAAGMPAELRLREASEKYILKQAVADLLPGNILERPKSGMQVPVEAWLQPRGPLHRWARQRILKGLTRYPYFDPRWLRQLMDWDLPGFLPRHGAKVWLLLSLESWLRTYLPED